MWHGLSDFRGCVAPGDAQGDPGEEHVDEVFGGDEGDVVEAVDLGVDVVDGDDGDLHAEQSAICPASVPFVPGEADTEMRTSPTSRACASRRDTEERDICRWRAIVSIVCPCR